MKKHQIIKAPWWLLILVVTCITAFGAPIEVNNHSFQSPELPLPGGETWVNGLPDLTDPADTQWQTAETGDQFVELIGGFFAEVGDPEDAQHIGTAAGKYLYQNLGIPYEPNTAYTLTVAIGYRNPTQSGAEAFTVVGLTSLDGAPSADNTLAGTDTNNQIEVDSLLAETHLRLDSVAFHEAQERSFGDVTVEYVTGADPPPGNIVIFLGDDLEGGRSHFDNVRLDFTSALDADGDKIPEEWETGTDRGVARNLDPAADDGAEDPDGDTLTNFQEFEAGTHPRLADTDGDGLNDNIENTTSPLDPDADGDTLLDGEEIFTHKTDPADADTDDDDFEDQAEIAAGTDPLDANSKPARGGAILVGGNFIGGDAENAGGTVTGTAGFVAQGNWNNLPGGTGAPVIANAESGDPSLIRVSWETNGPFIAGDAPAGGDQEGQLMHGILLPRGDDVGADNIATKITLKNIAYPFYDVYLYLNAAEGGGRYIVNDQEYLVSEVTPFDGDFVEITQAEDGVGNVIRFKMLSGSTTTITARQNTGGGGISGFQIERQEPADPSLLPIPEMADFGIFDGNPGPQEITMRMLNPGLTQTLNITGSTVTGDAAANFTVSGVPDSLAPGEGADVTVTFNPTDTVGIYRGTLEITSNDAVSGTTSISLIGQIKHANGLLAHYKMDEAGGTVMEDSSGNGYNGNYVSGSGSVTLGAASLAGEGTAVTFAEGGDAAYGEVPADIGFPTLADATYSFWIKQDAADIGSPSVLFSRSSSPANPFAVFIEEATGGADAVTWLSEAASETLLSEPFVVPDETFHVVYTYSDTNEDGAADVALYVNGVLNASANGTSGYPINTIAPFQIGGTAGQFGWTGSIDDFQIYETILSVEDIAAMFADPGSRAPVTEVAVPVALGELLADSVSGFGGPEIDNGWSYGYRNVPLEDASDDYDPAADFIQFPDDWWNGAAWDEPNADGDNVPWTSMGEGNTHPNGDNNGELHWTIRRWASSHDGDAAVTWTTAKENTGGGNGVTGAVHVNGVRVDSATVESDDGEGVERVVVVTLASGDVVDLILSPFGIDDTNNDGSDGSLNGMQINAVGGGGVDVLVNGSFEEPVLDNINANNLGTVPAGWSQTGDDATWNLIRNDGSAYGSGVDNAADGSQIIDLNGIFEIFQTFTLAEASDITFGASFANREGHDGSDPSTVGIYDAAGTALLSPEVSVDTSADPTPSDVWRSGEATVTGLAPGDYQIRIALNNFNNVDAVFAKATPATGSSLGDGLIAYFPLDGDFQDNAGDAHGFEVGAAPIEFAGGQFGQGVDLNGVDQYVSTPVETEDRFDFSDGTGFTVSAWFRVDAFDKSWQAIVTKGEGTNWRIHRQGDTDNLGPVAGGVNPDNGNGFDLVENPISVNDGQIHHVVITNIPDVSSSYYLDGVLIQEGFPGVPEGNEWPMMIGENANNGGNGRTFNGLIDDLAVWNRGLSADEVSQIFNGPSIGEQVGSGGVGGTTVEVPDIGTVVAGPTSVGLSFTGLEGKTYDIEYSTDLVTWSVVMTGLSGEVSFEDTDAARIGLPSGYYRGVQN